MSEFLNEQVPQARYARAMAKSYNQIQDTLAELKVAHKVANFMSQDERAVQIIEETTKAMGASEMLEAEMVEVFGELQNVTFLTNQEIALLPVSVIEALGVEIEDSDDKGGDIEAE